MTISKDCLIKEVLNVTDAGIYYIHDYYPRCRFNLLNTNWENIQAREDIISLKEGVNSKVEKFSEELKLYIDLIMSLKEAKEAVLVMVPSSNADHVSAISRCIENICDSSPNLIDGSDLIRRRYTIPSSHSGYRITVEQQLETMYFSKSIGRRRNTEFIILDDIVTNGTQMAAARMLLNMNGILDENIDSLAIGRTVR